MATETPAAEPDSKTIRKQLRRRTLGPVLGWGGAATLALAIVALASQTDIGGKQLRMAIADLGAPARAVVALPPQPTAAELEVKRLSAQVAELAADREKLTARIATLEQDLTDMTGSIKKQGEEIAAARASLTSSHLPSLPSLQSALPPVPAKPATVELASAPPPPPAPPQAEKPVEKQAEAPVAEPVPLPPLRVATANEPPPPAKLEYGVDLGGAATIDALRVHWASIKANYGPLLVGLSPVAAAHTKRPSGITYRLVAGPLPTLADASQFCVRMPPTRTGCRPAKYSGVALGDH